MIILSLTEGWPHGLVTSGIAQNPALTRVLTWDQYSAVALLEFLIILSWNLHFVSEIHWDNGARSET